MKPPSSPTPPIRAEAPGILLVNASLRQGGAARIAHSLYQGLSGSGAWRPHFLHGRNPLEREGLRTQGPWGLAAQGLFSFLGRHGGFGTGAARKAADLLGTLSIDLVHLHNLHGYYLNTSFIRHLQHSGLPVVWTLHDMWPLTGRCAYSLDCDRWQTGCGACPDLGTYPRALVDRSRASLQYKRDLFCADWQPRLVTPSDWLKEIYERSFMNRFPIQTIPNGIDTDRFAPRPQQVCRQRLGIPLDKTVILTLVADVDDPRKGVHYLREAFDALNQQDLFLLSAGRSRREHHHGSRSMHIDPRVQKHDLVDIYNSADIYVLCSTQDVFPTTVLEAMACGLPVIGFNSGGIREQVQADCAILTERGNTAALSAAIRHLAVHPDRRRDMGRSARERVLARFTRARMLESYQSLYRTCLT